MKGSSKGWVVAPFAIALAVLVWTAASASPPAPPLQAPSRIRLYTYSRDSAAGFQDELHDVFRRELGKHVESFTEVAYDAAGAQVSVQFLGQGELTVELGERDEPARYLWRPDEDATRFWALVRVGSFSKEFSLEGSSARDLSRLAKKVADWIRANSQPIREHSGARGPGGDSHGPASLNLQERGAAASKRFFRSV